MNQSLSGRSEIVPGVLERMGALVVAGLLLAVTDEGEEGGDCAGTQ